MSKALSPWQELAAATYCDGDYAYVADYTVADLGRAIASNELGDTIFNGLMIELGEREACDSLETAIHRVERIIEDVSKVKAALEYAAA